MKNIEFFKKPILLIAVIAILISSCKKEDDKNLNLEPAASTDETISLNVISNISEETNIFNIDKEGLVTLKPGAVIPEVVKIPAEGKIIADGLFKENKTIKHVDFNNVLVIGKSAFEKSSIISANMKKVIYINEYAFAESGITSVDIDYVSYIALGAFAYCSKLHKVNVASAYVIGHGFVRCRNLKEVTIGEAVGLDIFFDINCPNLEKVVIGNMGKVPQLYNEYPLEFSASKKVKISVPRGMKVKYEEEPQWSLLIKNKDIEIEEF